MERLDSIKDENVTNLKDKPPWLLCHAGQCGYIVRLPFEPDIIYDKKKWSLACERLRQGILLVEAKYKKRYGQDASVIIRR